MKQDQDIEKFIATIIDSLVMWELVVFLANNPGITDNAQGIAKRLGRRQDDLQQPLEILSKNGLMRKWGSAEDPVYAYEAASAWAKALDKFIKFNATKEGKLLIWSQLLKHGMR